MIGVLSESVLIRIFYIRINTYMEVEQIIKRDQDIRRISKRRYDFVQEKLFFASAIFC